MKAPNKNPKKIEGFFNKISKRYDLVNNITSFGVTPYWRCRINKIFDKYIFDNCKVLDVATGTGTSIKHLVKKNIEVEGIDISENMLKIAKKRFNDRKNVRIKKASAYKLPYKPNTFDIVTSHFSIRNFDNLSLALKQMHKVLKPNGKLIIVEFSVPKSKCFKGLYYFYITKILPLIAKIISRTKNPFEYFVHSVITWKKPQELSQDILKAGFENIGYKLYTNGVVAVHIATKLK